MKSNLSALLPAASYGQGSFFFGPPAIGFVPSVLTFSKSGLGLERSLDFSKSGFDLDRFLF